MLYALLAALPYLSIASRPSFHPFRLSVHLSVPCMCLLVNCQPIIVPMYRLTGGSPALQQRASSNRLAVLVCVRC